MSLVLNIQSTCGKKGISIPMLERELGFGKGAIYKWDTNSPSTDKLQKVAEYFKVPMDFFVFGFNRSLLASTLTLVKNGRTFSQFVQDTGVDEDELFNLCSGNGIVKPSLETIEKIAADNPIDHLIPRKELLEAAGYNSEEIPEPSNINPSALPPLTTKNEREIAKDLEAMLNALNSQSGMAAYNDTEDEEDRELLKSSLLTSMRLAKQIAKKKFTPKKYRKE